MRALTVTAVAPAAPGKLGRAAAPEELLRYLEALGAWRDQRRRELDALDEAALAAPDSAAYTADVTLLMALWKAVADRHDELLAVWDSGRVGRAERERLSTLIWGRLGGLAVSVPEACRLCDALAGQLRTRLSLDPSSADVAGHVRALRAQLERVRDLVAATPGSLRREPERELRGLDERLADVSAGAGRGADVTGPIATLEHDAALLERDLIVAAATRRDDARDAEQARTLRALLAERGARVRALAERCVAALAPAPRLAVPDVAALGPVPAAPADVDAYLVRLESVGRALDQAEQAYGSALTDLEELTGRLDAYHAKARATGRADDPVLAATHRAARAALGTAPARIDQARPLVEAYQHLVSGGGS